VYGDFVIENKTYGAAPFLLTNPTTTSSGTFSFTSSNTSVATVNSSTGLVTVVAPGTTEITATQAQTLTHITSTIRTTFVVNAAAPTFGSFVAPSKTFGDSSFTISAPTSSSSGVFTFSSSNTTVATINSSSGVVTIVGAGSTTITASQAAASPYAARSATSTLTVAKATPALSGFGGETAGLAGTRYVNYYSDNPDWFATATLHGDTVTSTQIQNFTSNADYYSWQWLGTFRSAAAGTYNFCTSSDDASHLWIGATATSGFTVTNAIVNNGGTHPVVTRCGNVTLAALTNYPIRIQFGEAGGGDAMSVYFTPPGGSAIYNGTGYFFSGGGLTKTVGDQPFTPTIPSSVSTGAITYSSSNPAVAAINSASGLITVIGGGTTTITAEQAATNNYNSSTVSTTLTVLSNPTISAMSVLTKNYNDAAFTLPAPTTNSDGTISYTSSNTSVATINATTGLVTIVGGGNTTITASVSATATYAAGNTAASLVVLSNPMLSSESSITKTPDTAPFTLTAPTTNSNGAISYTSSNTSVATINETTRVITLVGNGTTTITISQLATSTYAAASTTTTLTVSNMQSCLDIKNSTGTNTNGTYTISLNVAGTITNTQVYCLMDSAMSGGGWTLTMKAPRNSTSFPYSSNYWTSANTLNTSNLGNVTTDATNAKFNTFNYLSGTEMLAIFPDAGINGGSVTGHSYGWTWKTTIPSGPKTPLAIFSGPAEQFVSDAFTFGGFDTRIWTRQADIRFYGFNYNGNQKARWGFGWNENGGGLWPNGIRGSDDATGGIGLYHGSFSAADGSFCCTLSTGLNRSMSFETYIR